VVVDLYEALEVAPSADTAEIKAAISRQRRVWIRRQTSPDPDRRSAAEARVRAIDEAERVLLDPARRAEFDRQRRARATGSAGAASPDPVGPTRRAADFPATSAGRSAGQSAHSPAEWRERALAYLAQGNPGAAHRAAERACAANPRDAEAWALRGRAALAAGDVAAAEEELAEAARLGAGGVDVRRDLGVVHVRRERWERAIAELEAVLAEQPDDPVARAGVATAYAHTRRNRAARRLLAAVMKQPPSDPEARDAVAAALYDTALESMARLRDGTYLPLSRRQVALAARHGRWIERLKPGDSVLQAQGSELVQLAKNAGKAHWLPSRNKRWYVLALVMAFVPSVLRGDIYSGNVAWLMCAVVVAIYVWRHRWPAWRLRRRELAKQIGSKGI